jgi:hypothetical protein
MFITGKEEASRPLHLGISLFFLLVPGLIGVVYPDILNVFAVLAGYGGVLF